MQFVDVKNYIAFRKIFGNEKKTAPLISFLNAALEMHYANEDEGLKVAFVEAGKHNWSKEDLIAYDNASIAEQDKRGEIVAAEKKGVKKREIQIAREMKREGEPIDKIIKYSRSTRSVARTLWYKKLT
ncbi:MAG: hypothetical protein ACKVUS_19890 [Saprospiraceae bacterium]